MTSTVRIIAFTLTAILLMHLGGMAVDPIALHGATHDDPAQHAVLHHAEHGTVASDDLVTLESAWSCLDGEGVATPPRAPLHSTPFGAVVPVPVVFVSNSEERISRYWGPPPVAAAELRAFLQVFLN